MCGKLRGTCEWNGWKIICGKSFQMKFQSNIFATPFQTNLRETEAETDALHGAPIATCQPQQ